MATQSLLIDNWDTCSDAKLIYDMLAAILFFNAVWRSPTCAEIVVNL